MRKTFVKWLMFCVLLAFVITISSSYYLQTKQATNNSINMIDLRLLDAKKQIYQSLIDLDVIREEHNSMALNKALNVAEMLELNPQMLTSEAALKSAKVMANVDEINIVNAQGLIIATTNPIYQGFNMATGAQSNEFNQMMLVEKKSSFVQHPMPVSYDHSRIMQYAAAQRYGSDGYVQIGYIPKRLLQAEKIADIQNLAHGFRVGTAGKMLVSQNDVIVSVENPQWLAKNIRDFGLDFQDKKPGEVIDVSIEGVKMLAMYENFSKYKIIAFLPKDEMFLSRNSSIQELIIFNFFIFTMIFLIITYLVQRVVINGIEKVNFSLAKITAGDLEEFVTVRTNKEFSSLSDGINSMVTSLKTLISEAKTRIDKELELAKTIQLSALPNISALARWQNKVQVAASMNPAKEVGGDFYDFFSIDEQRLAFLIADVSGKGIGAALFMMKAKALFKQYLQAGTSVAEAFNLANNELCENNEAAMFVTVLGGVYDLRTRTYTYVNAGHNAPAIRQNGVYNYLVSKRNIVIGSFEDYKFKEDVITLAGDDVLFLYTDGVTEAFNQQGKLYSEGRLITSLNKISTVGVTEIIKTINQDVSDFAEGTEQSDDITILCIKVV